MRLVPNTFLLSTYPYAVNITYMLEIEEETQLSDHHSGALGRMDLNIFGVLTKNHDSMVNTYNNSPRLVYWVYSL